METDRQNKEGEEKEKEAATHPEPKEEEEEQPTKEEDGKRVQDKGEDEKMEVGPCTETASSCEETGKRQVS